MQAEMPFYESAEEALSAAVQHLGGAKQVGAMLWPDLGVELAARLEEARVAEAAAAAASCGGNVVPFKVATAAPMLASAKM